MIQIGLLVAALLLGKDGFFQAIEARDTVAVRKMLAEDAALASAQNDQGLSAVQQALFTLVKGEGFLPVGENEVLRAVVAAKPKLDIHDAAAVGTAADVKRLLAEDASRARVTNKFGWTPLHVAAFAGNTETAKVLLAAGADIHARAGSKFRNTPLQVALLTGEYATTKLLLENGADPLDRQAKGFAPIHEAAFLGRVDLIELLLAHGAELNSRSDDGRTALSEAVRGKHAAAAEVLKAKGAVMGEVKGEEGE